MPTNGYIALCTFTKIAAANIHAPYLYMVGAGLGNAVGSFAAQVRDANNGGALINLTTSNLGLHIAFFGVSASF
jgi:hypothetical protein